MSTNFKGKVIAITGAASGIGRATATMLAERGATLAIADFNSELLSTAASELKASGASVTATVLDVRDAAAVESWITSTATQHGRLDGAANVAGVISRAAGTAITEDYPYDEFEFIIDVNLKGVFNCLRAELRTMKQLILDGEGKEGQKTGSIVNAASVAGVRGLGRNAPYVASKHAVVGLTRTAAKECGGCGVRVNAIAPGLIDTPMVRNIDNQSEHVNLEVAMANGPLKRIGRPEEVAETICWLLCDGSSFVTGSVHAVDGGWTC
ncbi:NAD(P)-binding protein [Stipitochalara longipes BDJ]|nr:NAD(P)-binding protein [Stipitochalara longipes BDJ]